MIFHLCISRLWKFNSMGSLPLYFLLVCKKYVYMPKMTISSLLTQIFFFYIEFARLWYITCFVPKLKASWPQSHGFKTFKQPRKEIESSYEAETFRKYFSHTNKQMVKISRRFESIDSEQSVEFGWNEPTTLFPFKINIWIVMSTLKSNLTYSGTSQPAFICLRSTMETPEHCVKSIQS